MHLRLDIGQLGNAFQKLAGVFVLRRIEYLLNVTLLNRNTIFHDEHTVTDTVDNPQVVRNE